MTLVENTYDDLGRIKSSKRHGNSALTTDYTYNIRSWMKTLTTDTLFNQTLHYNDSYGGSRACYNGNISAMSWKAAGDTGVHGYRFSYDEMSRLTAAGYLWNGSPSANYDTSYTYNRQSNLTSLRRNGRIGASSYGLIDDLTLTLDGNWLTRVDDAATSSAYNNGFEFKDAVKQDNEYTYDKNGNMTKDLNKNITEIQYNCLNSPSKVLFKNGDNISNVYNADGTKLRTIRVIGGDTLTTDHCGNAIYENGVLMRLMTDEGYITMADTTYHCFIKDHQGNVRVVADGHGNIEEANDYYPFGGLMPTSSPQSVQSYKYNGKELEIANGLHWYDYGARQYDPALGRWNGVDPLCENYYSETPYGYCGSDPINYIDPNGLMKVVYNPDGTYKETTHNNWFHNTFVGRQEYIDYGDRKMHLSESEFWQWQRTGSYENVGPVTGSISNLELTLNEPATNFADGVAKYVVSSAYSYINSPKVWLTGSSWAGTYATPDERAGGFIDAATQEIPVNKLLKRLTLGSWYKFKYTNQHIPVKNKHAVYDMEMRKYNERISNPKTFKKMNESINKAVYVNENIEKENQ